MDYKDIFKKACLIQLSTSVWQGARTLEPALMEKLSQGNEWVKARKLLINPELLGPIKTSVHQARNMVQQFALPFPITSIYLIPKESLGHVDQRLEEFKERFWSKVNDFEDQYDLAREEAKQFLGELFNESDYPEDIATRFNFEWRFLTIDVPGKSNILTPEIYEREKQKFISMMEETKELAMSALREEFGEIVHNLMDRLNGNGNGTMKTFKASMLNKMHEFLDAFGSKNVFNDDQLAELVTQAKSIISGLSPYGLQYNKTIREKITGEMNQLKTAIDGAIEDAPRRKIRMAV